MTDEQNGFPEGWKPRPHQTVRGKIAEVVLNDMGYGPYPIVTLETQTGTVNVHAFHAVLKTELARRRPKIGDEIAITYLGKTPDSATRKGYHTYRVAGGQQADFSWDSFLPDAERDLAAAVEVPIDTAGLTPEQVAVPAAPEDDDGSVPF